MSERHIGIVMNGVTGRMGRNQHLNLSIAAIRREGGILLSDGTRLIPDPLLVGRDEKRLTEVARASGIDRWTTDLDAALADANFPVYFDAVATSARPENLRRAIAAGKHIYTEKPTAESLDDAVALYRGAKSAGVKHGVVADKLWAPGLAQLGTLVRTGFFGRILMVRIEGCYWVFEGNIQAPQRPSWNYRKADGGGMILDMMPHYAYMLEAIDGRPLEVVCHADTLVRERCDEAGQPYRADADDTCLSISRLEGGAIAQIMSSWCVRVRRDDIITVQVDGADGSAVAGLSNCWIQRREATPRASWSLDLADPIDYRRDWQRVPETETYKNSYRLQWELFLRHVAEDTPFPWSLHMGAKGVQFAAGAETSWQDHRWVELPDIPA